MCAKIVFLLVIKENCRPTRKSWKVKYSFYVKKKFGKIEGAFNKYSRLFILSPLT